MKRKITLVVRILLGLVFVAAGIVGLFDLVPPPPDLPEGMQKFNAGLMASGYFMKLLKVTETAVGLALLSGFFVPLALVVLAPIVLNIFLANLFLQPVGAPLGAVLGALLIYLAFFSDEYAPAIRQLFRPKS